MGDYSIFSQGSEFAYHIYENVFSGLDYFYSKKKGEACNCPCDDLVNVETPPKQLLTLSYIAQALVVTIVGLNMGFRYV
jgi:hypothetical protein